MQYIVPIVLLEMYFLNFLQNNGILTQSYFQGMESNVISDELFLIKDEKGFIEQPNTRPNIENHLLTLYIFLSEGPQPVDIFHLNHLPENKKQYVLTIIDQYYKK